MHFSRRSSHSFRLLKGRFMRYILLYVVILVSCFYFRAYFGEIDKTLMIYMYPYIGTHRKGKVQNKPFSMACLSVCPYSISTMTTDHRDVWKRHLLCSGVLSVVYVFSDKWIISSWLMFWYIMRLHDLIPSIHNEMEMKCFRVKSSQCRDRWRSGEAGGMVFHWLFLDLRPYDLHHRWYPDHPNGISWISLLCLLCVFIGRFYLFHL